MGSAIPVLATLAIWLSFIGVVTYAHKKAYGFNWWAEESAAVAMGSMGFLVLLMLSGLIVYVAMKAMGLVPHA